MQSGGIIRGHGFCRQDGCLRNGWLVMRGSPGLMGCNRLWEDSDRKGG